MYFITTSTNLQKNDFQFPEKRNFSTTSLSFSVPRCTLKSLIQSFTLRTNKIIENDILNYDDITQIVKNLNQINHMAETIYPLQKQLP